MAQLKFRLGTVAALVLAIAPAPLLAQVLLFEDFQVFIDGLGQPVLRCSGFGGAGTYLFPSGWRTRNVDNRTPSSTVAYVNEAWEVNDDFQLATTDCVAFSTSYYSPAGVANDWMWTPLIGPIPAGSTELQWNARSYDPAFPDGYEVRVMLSTSGPPTGSTGVIGNQLTNSTQVFTTSAEQTGTWITRAVDLSAFAGQSVYIAFHNNSDDKFLLVIDDITVRSMPLGVLFGDSFE